MPEGKYWVKPKLITVSTYIMFLNLAYPSIKPKLDAALANIGLIEVKSSHLQNLKCLFEFFIPVVHDNVIENYFNFFSSKNENKNQFP
jgi:hypothetical protein